MTSAVRRDAGETKPSGSAVGKFTFSWPRADRRSVGEAIERHDNNYTALRFVLAASVIYYHAFGLASARGFRDYVTGLMLPANSVGGLAVQAFFFLSGLFVTQSFCRDPYLLGFIAKRTLRIWPALFTCLLSTALVAVLISKPLKIFEYLLFSGWSDYVVQNAHMNLTWYIDGLFSKRHNAALNGPIHTLPFEAKMYVMLGLLAVFGLLRNPRRIRIAGLAILGIALSLPLASGLQSWLFAPDYSWSACCMFLAGVAIYGWADYIRPALWHGAVLAFGAWVTTGAPHALLFFATVIWALLFLGQNGAWPRPRQDLSYGVYLYGWPCEQFVVSLAPKTLGPYGLTLLALGAAALCASLSWRFVEKPTMALAHELSKARFGWTDLRRSPRFPEARRGARVLAILISLLCVGYALREAGYLLFDGAFP